MPRAPSTSRAPARGAWIGKTLAYSRYRLGATDLNSIHPTDIKPHGRGYIHRYNLCDVKLIHAKVAEMVKTLQVDAPPGDTVPENGDVLVRWKAKKDYDLNDHQINRIRPCRIETNPYDAERTPMRTHNVVDVQALAHAIEGLGAMEAPLDAQIAHDAIPYGNRWDDDYNPFDGLSSLDAANLLAYVLNG
ncbi:unnamed protein product [Peniophora sp. CBMAI 1063]|nr:unnamed protein product [Peniophora sp. CBMAI 1063]